MARLEMKCSNGGAAISQVKAIHGPQSRQVFYCGTSKLQSRQELIIVNQGHWLLREVSIILLSLSIAHCSNCSSVISAVGGIS